MDEFNNNINNDNQDENFESNESVNDIETEEDIDLDVLNDLDSFKEEEDAGILNEFYGVDEPISKDETVENNFFDTETMHPNAYVPNLSFEEARPSKNKTKGLKVFCTLLSFVLVAAISASIGYIAGNNTPNSNSTTKNNAVNIDLEKRPNGEVSSYSEVVGSVTKSVVSILVYSDDDNSAASVASGVVYSKDGYIVTNDHIYDSISNAKFLVRFSDGKEHKASYVAGDVRSDLAVIKLDNKVSNLKPAKFGNSDELIIGEEVVTIGYPSSYGDSETVTSGIISATNRRVTNSSTNYASSFIQTDATINPGNSGGALCNMHGQVIGITSAKLAGDVYDAISYAIPTKTMKRVVESLIKDGAVKDRAKLGITYTELNSINAESMEVPKGVYIASISNDSGLYGQGFSKGDIITHVNDNEITSSEVLLEAIESSRAGDSIKLTIYKSKSKKSKNINVKLSADVGSSSYNKKSSENDDPLEIFDNDEKNNNSSDDSNSKTFDFPLD